MDDKGRQVNNANIASRGSPCKLGGFTKINTAGIFYIPVGDKFAMVDFEDFLMLAQYRWYLNNDKYAIRFIKSLPQVDENDRTQINISMHTQIMKPKENEEVHHIDGNGLNNCKNNLYCCSRKKHMAIDGRNERKSIIQQGHPLKNRKYVGTQQMGEKWKAGISYHRRYFYLGMYKTEIEAARVYDKKAKELFGEFALLNFPETLIVGE